MLQDVNVRDDLESGVLSQKRYRSETPIFFRGHMTFAMIRHFHASTKLYSACSALSFGALFPYKKYRKNRVRKQNNPFFKDIKSMRRTKYQPQKPFIFR